MHYTPANPMVTITNDHGDIEHMRKSLFAEHFEGLGWWITATPAPKTPAPAAAPIVHNTSVRSTPVDDYSFASNNTGTCPCGWTSPTTTSSFMVNAWRTEHELAANTAAAA